MRQFNGVDWLFEADDNRSTWIRKTAMSRTRTRIEVRIWEIFEEEKLLVFFSFRKQRNSICQNTSSNNTTINGDSGNVSQEEHDDDQERYLEKIERIKRTENQVKPNEIFCSI